MQHTPPISSFGCICMSVKYIVPSIERVPESRHDQSNDLIYLPPFLLYAQHPIWNCSVIPTSCIKYASRVTEINTSINYSICIIRAHTMTNFEKLKLKQKSRQVNKYQLLHTWQQQYPDLLISTCQEHWHCQLVSQSYVRDVYNR